MLVGGTERLSSGELTVVVCFFLGFLLGFFFGGGGCLGMKSLLK